MKFLIISVLQLLIGITAICQTLGETEMWIADKIENFQFSTRENRDAKASWRDITAIVDFSNSGYLFVSETRYFKSAQPPTMHRSHVIPIKHMKSVRYRFEDDYVEVEFRINSGNVAGQNMILREIYDEQGSVSQSQNVDKFNIILSRSFSNDNLPDRFRKAVNHLVELNGGVIEEEEF